MNMIACIILVAGLALPSAAEIFEAVPVADTYIWANYSSRNYGSSPTLAVGSASKKFNDARFQALLRWNLPRTILGATVSSAVVTFPVCSAEPGSATMDVYLLTNSWNEAETTWILRDKKHHWPKGNGALGATTGEVLARSDVAETHANDGLPTTTTIEIDITEIAKKWADGMGNHGLLLRIVHVQYSPFNMNIFSREYAGDDYAPKLVVKYKRKSNN